MRHATLSFARMVWAVLFGVAIAVTGLSASAQQPAQPPAMAGAPAIAAPPAMPAAPAATPQGTAATPGVPTVPGAPPATPAGVASPAAATPEDANPFSNVKPVDNQALKQELPALEQRLHNMESQMSAIQQVGSAIPADALNAPGSRAGAPGKAGAPAPIDEEAMELQASTFVACVNGQALFRDTDQKPFFVDAKEANQNEAVHRIGGCKH